jgi:hypothetical protein
MIKSPANGNLYVADDLNHTVRKVLPNGTVSTLAGKAGYVGAVDGPGALARFNRPSGVAVDSSGNVYVCDRGNHCIRKISPNGEVTTFAGSGSPAWVDSAIGTLAAFNGPSGLSFLPNGNLLYAYGGKPTGVREVTRKGEEVWNYVSQCPQVLGCERMPRKHHRDHRRRLDELLDWEGMMMMPLLCWR